MMRRFAGVILAGVILVLAGITPAVYASPYYLYVLASSHTQLLYSGQMVEWSGTYNRVFPQSFGTVDVLQGCCNGGLNTVRFTCNSPMCWVGVFGYNLNSDPIPDAIEVGATFYRGTDIQVLDYDPLPMVAFGQSRQAFMAMLSAYMSQPLVKGSVIALLSIYLVSVFIRSLLKIVFRWSGSPMDLEQDGDRPTGGYDNADSQRIAEGNGGSWTYQDQSKGATYDGNE